jgi:hypothetical protein
MVLDPTYTGRGDAVVPLGIAALGLLLFTVFHPGARLARQNGDDKGKHASSNGQGGNAVDADTSLAAAEAHH